MPVRCPLCGAVNATCGGQPGAHVVGITIEKSEKSMGDLKKYDVVVNGMKTTLKLTEKEAKARGLISDKKSAATQDKKA